jgi:hypothetical protein
MSAKVNWILSQFLRDFCLKWHAYMETLTVSIQFLPMLALLFFPEDGGSRFLQKV